MNMESLRRFIQNFSPSAEYALVLLGAFGYFVVKNVWLLLRPTAMPPISESHLEGLLVYEPVILILLGAFLYLRGWTTARLGMRPSARDTLVGFGLAVAYYVVYILLWWGVAAAGVHLNYAGNYRELVARGLGGPAVIGVSLLNPVYEETFLCGYIVTTAKSVNRTVAGVNVSVAMRLLCHLYQGGIGVLGIIPLGLIFAWWYARTGRLWPVLVAHGLLDFAGLWGFVR